MRSMHVTLISAALLSGATLSAQAPYVAQAIHCASNLPGEWRASDPNTHSITRLRISLTDPGHLQVHAFGKCSPTDCDWGPSVAVCEPGGTVIWSHSDAVAKRKSTLRVQDGRLILEMRSVYPGGGQATTIETFVKPLSKFVNVSDISKYKPVLPHPNLGTIPPNPPSAARGLDPDGTVVINLPDGSVKRIHPDGSVDFRTPDGQIKVIPAYHLYSQVIENLPPAPPDSGLGFWLSTRNNEMLSVIRAIVKDDAAVQRYADSETGTTEYAIFKGRVTVIERLVSQ